MARISPCTSQNPRYTPAEGPHTPEKMVSHVGGPNFHKGFLEKWGPRVTIFLVIWGPRGSRSLFFQDYGDATPALGCIYLLNYEKCEKNELFMCCVYSIPVYMSILSPHMYAARQPWVWMKELPGR